MEIRYKESVSDQNCPSPIKNPFCLPIHARQHPFNREIKDFFFCTFRVDALVLIEDESLEI